MSDVNLKEIYEEISKKLSRKYNLDELYPNSKIVSSSQLSSLNYNPKRFFDEYILDKRDISMPMIIGILFSELYSRDTPKEVILEILANLTERGLISVETGNRLIKGYESFYYTPQVETEKELRVEYRDFTIRITLDGLLLSAETIIENKTGKTKWSDEVVKDDFQLTLQAWGYWKLYKKVPKKIMLNWIDLNGSSNKVINSFTTKRKLSELKAFERETLDDLLDKLEFGIILDEEDIKNDRENVYPNPEAMIY